jgi:hypothetical protein
VFLKVSRRQKRSQPVIILGKVYVKTLKGKPTDTLADDGDTELDAFTGKGNRYGYETMALENSKRT